MKTKKVVIATATFYRSVEETRFKLAEQMCRKGASAGHTVIVIDASPDSMVRERLTEAGALVYPELLHGMGMSRRQAFFLAWEVCASREDRQVILWTEAEKAQLIQNIQEIIEPIEKNEADIVIPARSEKSWQTWPKFQQETEKRANAVYAEATGLEGFDPMHGPVAFCFDAARCFALFNPREYGVADRYIQHYAALEGKAAGWRLTSVVIDTAYPREQRAEEEGELAEDMKAKREAQLTELTADYRKLANRLRTLHGENCFLRAD